MENDENVNNSINQSVDNVNNNMGLSPKKEDKNITLIIVSLLLILIIGGIVFIFINKGETKKVQTLDKNVYSKYRISSNDLNNFDLKFMQIEANNKNMIYSPLSIKYALGMLKEGTEGDSKTQIDNLIGDYKTNKYINSANMSFANAMFIRNTFKDSVKDSYITNLQDKYNAEVIYDQFENPNSINSWISNKTFGLIDKLVDDVSNDNFYLVNALAIDMEWNKVIQINCKMLEQEYNIVYNHEKYSAYIPSICNNNYGTVKFNNNTINSKAVEFGASINNYDIVSDLGEENIRATITKEYIEWLKEDTCGNSATSSDVNTYVDEYIKEINENYKKVELSTDFKFYNDENVKVFAKDLKEYNGNTLEYVGIMPKKEKLDEFIKKSDAKSLNKIINSLKTIELNNFEKGKVTKIIGGLPLFKYDYKLNLKEDLKELGIKDVFSLEKANLSKMISNSGNVITDALHQSNIEFSNEGIKASAATIGGGGSATSCKFEHLYDVPIVTIDLTFNNPFMYIIRDKKTGEAWFTGTVYEPIVNENPSSRVISE